MTPEERKDYAFRLARAQTPTPPPERLRTDILLSLQNGPFGASLTEGMMQRAVDFLSLERINDVYTTVTTFAAELMARELSDEELRVAAEFYESSAGQKVVKTRMTYAEDFRRYNNKQLSELFNSVLEYIATEPVIVMPDGSDARDVQLIVP